MAGFAGVRLGGVAGSWELPWAGGSTPPVATTLAKPQPPCTPRELLLKSVLLPRIALQLSSPWSSMLVPLLNMPSSGFVWRGPVPKIQVTPSASPSGWQDPQLLQASFDCLPLKSRGMMLRIGVPKMSVVGDTKGG